MSDIVERLRHKSAVVPSDNTLCDEAADEITRLRAEIERLREAMDGFDCYWCRGTGNFLNTGKDCEYCADIRAALAPPPSADVWRCKFCGDVQPVGICCQCGATDNSAVCAHARLERTNDRGVICLDCNKSLGPWGSIGPS